jgi:hypothetical protein
MNRIDAKTTMDASADASPAATEEHVIKLRHLYVVECLDKDGNLKWREEFENLVVTVGRNKYLDATLKTGLAVPAWFVGLITGPGAGNVYVAGDTMAVHAGWTEFTTYVSATRPSFTPGAIAAGSVDNSAAKASFVITVGGTVAGAFLVDDNTKGGVAGTLLGEGNFTTGDRVVIAGDTVNVTITCTIT